MEQPKIWNSVILVISVSNSICYDLTEEAIFQSNDHILDLLGLNLGLIFFPSSL